MGACPAPHQTLAILCTLMCLDRTRRPGGTMRYVSIFVAVLLFASYELALANNASDAKADNPRLSAMFDEDQADRTNWRIKKIDSDSLFKRDEERRAEVKRMLAIAQVRTAHDFFCAALIFHHGHTIDDYRLATSLAWVSMTIEPTNKDYAYLTASTWDRFMKEQGKPQWYGTKCSHESVEFGKDQLYRVDESAVTDKDRARFDLKPLEVMRAHTSESIRLSGADSTC
jgi:hypothetical protein